MRYAVVGVRRMRIAIRVVEVASRRSMSLTRPQKRTAICDIGQQLSQSTARVSGHIQILNAALSAAFDANVVTLRS